MFELSFVVTILGATAVGVLFWAARQGPAVVCAAVLILVDGIVPSVLEHTSLYGDATHSQPALRVAAVFVGVASAGALGWVVLRSGIRWSELRWTTLDRVVGLLVVLALVGAAVGLARGSKASFLLGDTYRALIVPVVYLIVRLLATGERERMAVLKVMVAVGVGLGVVQVAEIAERLRDDAFLSGVGAPPLIVLAWLLAVLATRPLGPRALPALIAGMGAFAALNLLSLTRGLWVVTAVMAAVAAVVGGTRSLTRIGAPALALCGVVFVLGATETTVVGRQIHQRVVENRFPSGTQATLLPPVNVRTSFDERETEANDAMREWLDHGAPAVAFGLGSGAEYPTPLPEVEDTSSPGQRHQIHITWISLLVRYGVLGLALAVAVIGLALALSIRAFRESDGERRVLALTLLLWLVGSSVAVTNAYGFLGDVPWAVVLALVAGTAAARHTGVAGPPAGRPG